MDKRYENLRRTIYNKEAELNRFQYFLVNKDLKVIRNSLWGKMLSTKRRMAK
jgi:hypothetical protein